MTQTSKTQARIKSDFERYVRRDEPGYAKIALAGGAKLRINLKIIGAVAISLSLWAAIAFILFE